MNTSMARETGRLQQVMSNDNREKSTKRKKKLWVTWRLEWILLNPKKVTYISKGQVTMNKCTAVRLFTTMSAKMNSECRPLYECFPALEAVMRSFISKTPPKPNPRKRKNGKTRNWVERLKQDSKGAVNFVSRFNKILTNEFAGVWNNQICD